MALQQSRPSPNGRARKKTPAPVFVSAAVVIFFLSLSAADSVGFVPYYIDGSTRLTTGGPTPASEHSVALSSLPVLGDLPAGQAGNTPPDFSTPAATPTAYPDRIVIPSIDLDLPVQNIDSRDTDVLDEALNSGPVRYVDSAKLGERGNMLVFAHSSHLPIVHNKMFQAFNRISELKPGDGIQIKGEDGKTYVYSVTSVRKTDANDTVINLSPTQGTKLTLSTCDTLTSKSSRFVVEADFVGVL